MNLIHTPKPDPSEAEDLMALAGACRRRDGIHLSCALEEASDFFLLYDNRKLVSALTLFFPEPELCECGAFTLPEMRQKGYFSQLFSSALDCIDSYDDAHGTETLICFATDRRSPDTMAALEALEAEYWYSEFLMTCPLGSPLPPAESGAPAPAVKIQCSVPGEYLFFSSRTEIPAGSCRLEVSGESAYLFSFEILPAMRRQGVGTACIQKIAAMLADEGLHSLTLQVSEQNLPAVNLYKKTGFQISETLSYYLY